MGMASQALRMWRRAKMSATHASPTSRSSDARKYGQIATPRPHQRDQITMMSKIGVIATMAI